MKCRGDGCPKKESCERFLSPEAKVQSWWSMSPYDRVSGECDHFWQAVQQAPETTPWYEPAPESKNPPKKSRKRARKDGNEESDTEQ